jgi:hypothetical protein
MSGMGRVESGGVWGMRGVWSVWSMWSVWSVWGMRRILLLLELSF